MTLGPVPWLARMLALLYGVMWTGGVLSYTLRGGVSATEGWTAPAFLLLAGVLVLLTAPAGAHVPLLLAAAIGYAAELLGVHTGFPFGEYRYTDRLPPLLFGVPVVMTSAWLVLVAYVRELLRERGVSTPFTIVISAVWLTAIDLVIDPAAAGPLDYWQWASAGGYYGVPASNFLGWFVVSLLVFGVLAAIDRHPVPHPWARHIGLSIVLFFAIIAAAFGMWGSAAIGLVLCIAGWRGGPRPR